MILTSFDNNVVTICNICHLRLQTICTLTNVKWMTYHKYVALIKSWDILTCCQYFGCHFDQMWSLKLSMASSVWSQWSFYASHYTGDGGGIHSAQALIPLLGPAHNPWACYDPSKGPDCNARARLNLSYSDMCLKFNLSVPYAVHVTPAVSVTCWRSTYIARGLRR
jgi:hypothetical protein